MRFQLPVPGAMSLHGRRLRLVTASCTCAWLVLASAGAPAQTQGTTGVASSASPAASASGAASPRAAPPVAAPGSSTAAGASPAPAPGSSTDAPTDADTRALDEQTQALKKDVVDLNRDLYVLEEELLYPANTQVAVFLSMDVGTFFALDSVQLKIDQKEVANYLYTPREVNALLKGGVQRIYIGNLKTGTHELVAFFSGKGPDNRDYRRGATIKFDKSIGAHYLELKIDDRQRRLQPEFEIKDWGE
jgi:hypothetical protein